MNELKQIPFLRLAIPFISGIAAHLFFGISVLLFKYFIAVGFLFLLFSYLKFIRENYTRQWFFGIISQSLFFLLGAWLAAFHYNHSGIEKIYHNSENTYIVKLAEPASEKEKTIRTFLEFNYISQNGNLKPIAGKVLAYFQKDSLATQLELGDMLILKGSVQEIGNPKNPNEFDYKKYLSFHKVTGQIYIKSGNWKIIKKQQGNALFYHAYKIQKYLISTFQKAGLQGDEYAVASALIIGYTDKIDAEMKKAYSSTGAMHILSVSGLHVGIVFIVFNFLLFFLDKIKHGKIIKAVILIFLLWAYATITGLSAAVIRAATMFSFVVIGKSLNRNVNIINTIIASAVVILIFNPLYLADVGFQLSYLAVIGIVLFQADIHKLLYIKNKWLDKVWALVSVSLAAQLSTLPITLYHFHQFPNYFLITNILVIPISTVVLYLGIAVFSLSFSEFCVHWLGKALSLSVKILNEIIIYIEKLPYSIAENILVSPVEAVLFFLLMIVLSIFLYTRKLRFLQISLAIIAIILFSNILFSIQTLYQNKLIIYCSPGKTAIDFINKNSSVLLTDIASDDRKYQTIKHHWKHSGILKNKVLNFKKTDMFFENKNIFIKHNFILFNGTKIAIIDWEILQKKHRIPLQLDYLVYTDKSIRISSGLFSDYKTKNYIFNNLNEKQFDKISRTFSDKKTQKVSILKNEWFEKNF